MLRSLVCLCLLSFIGMTAIAQSKNAAAIKTVDALERQRFAAQVNKDTVFLQKIFSDSLVYIHAGGGSSNKASYIKSIADGKTVYLKIEVQEINARAFNKGKTVVINGSVTFTQPGKEGKDVLAHLKYVDVYIKDKTKGWQMVMWQSLKLQ